MNELEKARQYLNAYCKNNNIEDICMLFSKDVLVENVNERDWDWAVNDEMETKNISQEQANDNAREWFLSMDNHVLFYDHMSEYSRHSLIQNMADDLQNA